MDDQTPECKPEAVENSSQELNQQEDEVLEEEVFEHQIDAPEESKEEVSPPFVIDPALVPSEAVGQDEVSLQCPACSGQLEPWRVECHHCGQALPDKSVIQLEVVKHDKLELQDSFDDWLNKGYEAMRRELYGEAQACFCEALKRAKALTNAQSREILVRKELARALERQEKRAEASEQYMLLAKLTRRKQDVFEQRARQLSESTMDVMALADQQAKFSKPEKSEIQSAPLYCLACKRLLLESEVYGYRKGQIDFVRCFCGFESGPCVKRDAKHIKALKNAPDYRDHRSKLIQAASEVIPGGRTRMAAICLALLLGGVGGHKFYLGERAHGIAYLALCWTLLPWIVAVFEAINYAHMSRVTFNLIYNIESILLRMPADAEEENLPGHEDVFSMEVSESSDDIVDQFTKGR